MNRAQRQAQAEKQSRTAGEIADAGLRRGLRTLESMRRDVLRVYRDGGDIRKAVSAFAQPLADEVQDAMVAGHLRGRLDVFTQAIPAVRAKGRRRLDRLADMTAFLEARLKLSDGDFAALRRMYGSTALQISDTLTSHANEHLLAAVAESVKRGEHTEAGLRRMREAFDTLGLSGNSPFHAETVWRTYSHMAYAAGGYNADSDPAIREMLTSYTYSTVGDDRVRPTHGAMEGVTAPPDDPLWRSWKPPAGYNCRCTLLRNFDAVPLKGAPAQVEQEGVMVNVAPDDGFSFDPGEVFRDMLQRVEQPSRIAASHHRREHDVHIYAHLPPRLRVVACAIDLEEEAGYAPYQKDIAARLGLNRSTVARHICELAGDLMESDGPAAHRCHASQKGRAAVARITARRNSHATMPCPL